jgi:hypothetical protein
MYGCWRRGGLTILPNHNLVTNLGFGADATHTTDARSPLAGLPVEAIGALRHPRDVARDVEADAYTWNQVFRSTHSEASVPRNRSVPRWWRALRRTMAFSKT